MNHESYKLRVVSELVLVPIRGTEACNTRISMYMASSSNLHIDFLQQYLRQCIIRFATSTKVQQQPRGVHLAVMTHHSLSPPTTDSIDWLGGNSDPAVHDTSVSTLSENWLTYPRRVDLPQVRYSKIDSIQEDLLLQDRDRFLHTSRSIHICVPCLC